MTSSEPGRSTTRRLPGILPAGLLVVVAAIAVPFIFQSPPSSSTAATSPTAAPRSGHGGGPAAPIEVLRGGHLGALGDADGAVPDGTTAFDDVPAVANLDPPLLHALRRATTDASGEGVQVYVSSGWRSRAYQQQLFREAVSKYGSTDEAARWVALPGTSAHELGDAVDIGHSDAATWLSEHGARYGLCRVYANEPWHYELFPEAVHHGCPHPFADPTHDPRMQQ